MLYIYMHLLMPVLFFAFVCPLCCVNVLFTNLATCYKLDKVESSYIKMFFLLPGYIHLTSYCFA